MLFNSVHYFIFALIVIPAYFFLPERWKRWWLLLASLYFYAIFRIPFVIVLLASVVISYVAALQMESQNQLRRQAALWFAVVGNLLLLYFFKYIDFSFRAYNSIFGLDPCKDSWALHTPGVILPLGISFFTLQSIAYAVDVYRGTIPATRKFTDFLLFLSFFPQLVAGPIMRAGDLIHQFSEKHPFQEKNLRLGLALIAFGIFKKTIVADQAGELVDTVFADPLKYNWVSQWISVFLHTVQIYGDFAGYSDIAIGSGLILGFTIPLNFRRPLLADSMTDVWRRWHISLSTWLRDYIYIPLGGSRVSKVRSYINLAIPWIVTGLWHGADWTFLLWGIVHLVAILGERALFSSSRGKSSYGKLPAVVKTTYALTVFSFALFFFRARPTAGFDEGVQTAFAMIYRSFTFAGGELILPSASLTAVLAALVGIELLLEYREDFFDFIHERPVFSYALSVSILLTGLFIYSVTVSPQFIYFQF